MGQEETASSCTRAGLDGDEEQFLPQRVLRHWNRLPRAGLESPTLGMFTPRVAEASVPRVSGGLGSAGERLGLMILKVFSSLGVLVPRWVVGRDEGSQGPRPSPPQPLFALVGRKLSGKAGIDEVMAAAVLTSLSTSPLVLGHPPAAPAPEPGGEVWKEAPTMSSSCSSSSNTSGDWSWDPASDRSTPSTPSPPLSSHPDGTHFVFGEPVPRKRKNSTKVMFKCLWKSCGKVLSSSSGMQKHIRTAHLGRKADLEQSDGEEDFYYTELDVDVESLTDGLSSLTPVSPTSSVPPAFPGPEAQGPVPPVPLPTPAPPPPKPPAVPRRPRGEAKKCRKVYGMENRELWCTACRWKKACQRFLD
uniref:SLC2A4 regulator n=1 Tax=Strigops habroptila TaxID=2489341 RepID=A0A672UH65_STRHB